MKYIPGYTPLRRHIDHYWIIRDAKKLFSPAGVVYAYPGIKPEILMILKGYLHYSYQGKSYRTNQNIHSSHIDGEFLFDSRELETLVIIHFKPRSIAALQPFLPFSAGDLMKNPLCNARELWGEDFDKLRDRLIPLGDQAMVAQLDEWFSNRLARGQAGFMTEVFDEVPYGGNLRSVQALTRYSYSTLERHMKSETGMTPKKFLSLRRYKGAVEELYDTLNPDWMHYVEKYGYYDQSHFIREIKKYTSFTPAQLLKTPGLRSYRPV